MTEGEKMNANEINSRIVEGLKGVGIEGEARSDMNKAAWGISKSLATEINKELREAGKAAVAEAVAKWEAKVKEMEAAHSVELANARGAAKKEEEGFGDAELRGMIRRTLVEKLADGSWTASDIGQVKDIFGLSSAVQDVHIEYVQFGGICEGCPRLANNGGADVQ
jgi:hypothetical protein